MLFGESGSRKAAILLATKPSFITRTFLYQPKGMLLLVIWIMRSLTKNGREKMGQ
jgi:hypothetical protein